MKKARISYEEVVAIAAWEGAQGVKVEWRPYRPADGAWQELRPGKLAILLEEGTIFRAVRQEGSAR